MVSKHIRLLRIFTIPGAESGTTTIEMAPTLSLFSFSTLYSLTFVHLLTIHSTPSQASTDNFFSIHNLFLTVRIRFKSIGAPDIDYNLRLAQVPLLFSTRSSPPLPQIRQSKSSNNPRHQPPRPKIIPHLHFRTPTNTPTLFSISPPPLPTPNPNPILIISIALVQP